VTLAGAINLEEGHPDYFKPLAFVPRHLASSQWTWIEDQMKASTADFLLVAGHYPVYSPGEHGPTSTLVSQLKPLLEKYNAHYFCGHDHILAHMQEPSSKVNYILSGMGVGKRTEYNFSQ
jgi:hypothetical protein